MPRDRAPHPPDETPDDVREMLRAHHPELSDAQLDSIVGGEPTRRKRSNHARSHWTVGEKGQRTGRSVVGRGVTRPARRTKIRHLGDR